MTKDEILLAQKEFLFPAVFHYFKDPLVVSQMCIRDRSLVACEIKTDLAGMLDRR